MKETMSFKEALKKLNIEDYGERIFNSNLHGELFHLDDYIKIAKNIRKPEKFRGVFEAIIEYAKKEWEKPETIFQHILHFL